MGVPPVESWQNEHRIDVLLNNPAVRFRIEQAAQSSSRPMSAEQFLKTSGSVMGAIPGMHVAGLVTGASGWLGQRIADKSPLRVKRATSTVYSQPIGHVTVALLCALARNSCPIQRIIQGEHGCFFEAKLPSNWQTWNGVLACTVTSKPDGTEIEIGTTVRGQLIDYGRSRKVISTILDEVRRDSASF